MATGRSPQPDGTATELKELRGRFEDYCKEWLDNYKTKPCVFLIVIDLDMYSPCRILRVQVEKY